MMPPTLIGTGKVLRSVNADDENLSKYLETYLKVPNLTLPLSLNRPRFFSPSKIVAEIDLSDLASGGAAAVRWIVATAAEAGGFRLDGGDVVTCEEIDAAVEVGGAVFESVAAKRIGLVYECRFGDEICWHRSKRKQMEPDLEDVPADTCRAFRERMEVMASKLEMVADCISHILCEHVRDEAHSHKPPKLQSVLFLRKCRRHPFNDLAAEQHRDGAACFLSIHLPISENSMFHVHSSSVSASFSLPVGSILVTVGQQLMEWCNGEYRTLVGEKLLNSKSSPNSLYSMEFIVCAPPDSLITC